ncbi:hypothetical protein DK926_19660 [Rhodococcus sp. Eu-32]|uniref:hypothetical protein n=1 Tax=Rhodococcus sp. Eu-32 TaxID=1017319 RepID=UPI000DF4A759|nr:hypothetical protein [Rhodococcus sp. Eu-32]RRQ26212.1 hypothetical protein DK926_19660 [Rhodococcus sp. Eu-32]
MDRPIDFSRPRWMLCGRCTRQWMVDLDWIDRWEQSRESCPDCGVTCETETGPRVTVAPDDPALRNAAERLPWFHTSTHPDWPAEHFAPEESLSAATKEMFEQNGSSVASWAERQRAKALHIGTYEAAVHNMLRRISDQGDRGKQFYLYRVRLTADITLRDSWIADPGGLVGDVPLTDVCPPGVLATRYRNDHEDPGGLSLALGRSAIASTQRISIPEAADRECDHLWVQTAVAELENAVPTRRAKAHDLVVPLAQQLPVNLRRQFSAAVAFDEDQDTEEWATYTNALVNMVTAPELILAALDQQPIRCL